MIDFRCTVFALVVTVLPAVAQAQAPEPTRCFEIITLPSNMQPYSPVLLNHCTGGSWMLGHENISDAAGKATGEFVYRWYPLNLSTEEAFMLKAGAPPVPPVKPVAKPLLSAPAPVPMAAPDAPKGMTAPQ